MRIFRNTNPYLLSIWFWLDTPFDGILAAEYPTLPGAIKRPTGPDRLFGNAVSAVRRLLGESAKTYPFYNVGRGLLGWWPMSRPSEAGLSRLPLIYEKICREFWVIPVRGGVSFRFATLSPAAYFVRAVMDESLEDRGFWVIRLLRFGVSWWFMYTVYDTILGVGWRDWFESGFSLIGYIGSWTLWGWWYSQFGVPDREPTLYPWPINYIYE